jgi:hypothetical protein
MPAPTNGAKNGGGSRGAKTKDNSKLIDSVSKHNFVGRDAVIPAPVDFYGISDRVVTSDFKVGDCERTEQRSVSLELYAFSGSLSQSRSCHTFGYCAKFIRL